MDVGGEGQARPARFFDGKTALERPVTVRARGATVLIQPGDGSAPLEWQLAGLVMKGAPDGVVTFCRRRDPARLMVTDAALLQSLRPGLQRWPRRPAAWPTALAACLAVAVLGIVLVDSLPGALAPLVPLAW